jgi:ATP-dependent Lhr-like helicase
MITRVTKKHTKPQVLDLLDPIISEWFDKKFSDITPSQAYAIPLIHNTQNVLVASPTGSGKTLTAFLSIINELFLLGKKGELENKIYCLYVSPLKALANDIERNLNAPLREIYELAAEKGVDLPKIRVGVRSGDTSAYEKQKMNVKAPHILITTPETLAIVLSTKKFSKKLRDIRYVIVDEIHEISSSKRGVHLSISLERLQYHVSFNNADEAVSEIEKEYKKNYFNDTSREFVRIGLSATQAPIREIAKFLVGYNGSKMRDINIIEVSASKELDLKVLCPVQDMNMVPYEIVNAKMYNVLREMIDTHRTTLVFTNTRSGTEAVVYKLQEQGLDKIAAHHGSLSKEIRLDVEDKLKNGDLDATICSTSLELGIDIGYIDLVVQIGSPKSIAKGLQRIGRAGHALHEVSKGRIVVFDRDDLVECAVLVKNAYDGNIDRIKLLKNSLDVLAQSLVGMSIERRWDADDAFKLVKNSYSFHELKKKEFQKVLNYIGGKHSLEDRGVYGKVRYYPEDKVFGIRKGTRLIYNLNLGTIPQEASYKVMLLGTGIYVGTLSEKFVERLGKRDVFILGGKSYEFQQVKGMKVYVRDAHGKKPTVPSWTGEMLPRSFDLSVEIGKFRDAINRKIQVHHRNLNVVEKWLVENYYLDEGSAKSIVNYFVEQQRIINKVPTDKQLLIEGYIDGRGHTNLIFHYCFGRRVNDALSRAYAYELSKKYKSTVRISLTDDNFMLTLPKRIKLTSLENLVTSTNLMTSLKYAVKYTELFKQRFRHVAVRSFMILKNYKGREISIRKQHRRSQRILDVLQEWDGFPVVSESYNEILHDTMDIDNALEVIEGIEKGKTSVVYSDYSNTPSPFAHNVILQGISDIILMEDRSALLRELHKKVLEKVFTKKELEQAKFDINLVELFFKEKQPEIKQKDDIVPILKAVGPLRLFVEKGRNIFNYAALVEEEGTDKSAGGVSRDHILGWCNELVNEGKITSLWRDGLYWIPKNDLGIYMTVYGSKAQRLDNLDKKIVTKIKELNDKAKVSMLIDELNIPKDKLMDRLRNLERRHLIYRQKAGLFVDTEDLTPGETGNIVWGARDPGSTQSQSKLNFVDAVDHLILQYLKLNAPATLTEISFDLKLDEDLVKQLLNNLEDDRKISAGNYVIGKDIPQFMLTTDLVKLELEASGKFQALTKKNGFKPKVFAWDQVINFINYKEFAQVDSIDEYFDKFGIVTSPREIFSRCPNFSIENWWKLINKGKILQGRFVRGRVCYVRKKDADMYVDVYRTATLNPIDRQVLKIIRKNPGATRYEIQTELGLRKTDVVDSIEKLDRNLYIIRRIVDEHDVVDDGTVDNDFNQNDNKSKLGMFKRRGMNRYILFKNGKQRRGTQSSSSAYKSSMKKIVLQFLKAHTPVSIRDIYLYTGFNRSEIKLIIDELEAAGKIVKFISITEAPTEMYAFPEELNMIAEERKPDNRVRILSLLDPFSRRVMASTPMGMLDGWFSPIVYNGHIIGMVELWKMASCIDIRELNLEYDNLEILKGLITEMDNLMEFYRMQGIDILRIKKIFGIELSELIKKRDEVSKKIKQVFLDNGYHLIQGRFLTKGKLVPESYSKNEILKYVFFKQHILKSNKFNDPFEAIETMGGIGSDYELKLRLNGKFRSLKELQKRYELAAGRMIPDYYMYCTEDDSRVYQRAKGRELDPDMEYVLENIPFNYGIQPKLLGERLTIPDKKLAEVRKRLYDGIYIVRTPTNWYKRVRGSKRLSKRKARELVVKRIIDNFGIFSAENLAAYTKHEFKMSELRSLLRDLEQENYLVKGYFIKGDDTLYWMLKNGLEKELSKIKRSNLDLKNLQFVLNPQDQLAHYLTDEIRQKFGSGSYYVVFNGLEMTGGFKASKKSNLLEIKEFIGGDSEWDIVENFMYQNGLGLVSVSNDEVATEEIYDDFGSYQ